MIFFVYEKAYLNKEHKKMKFQQIIITIRRALSIKLLFELYIILLRLSKFNEKK